MKGWEWEYVEAAKGHHLTVLQRFQLFAPKCFRCPTAGVDRNPAPDQLFIAASVVLVLVGDQTPGNAGHAESSQFLELFPAHSALDQQAGRSVLYQIGVPV